MSISLFEGVVNKENLVALGPGIVGRYPAALGREEYGQEPGYPSQRLG